jgi:hypothetical protein
LIHESRFGIHDLSRCKAITAGDYVRMNMPFELGIDHGSKRFGTGQLAIDRKGKGDRGAFRQLLARSGGEPPQAGDELPDG